MKPKRKHALITTPIPTAEEVARRLGISKKRLDELTAIAERFIVEDKSRPKGKKT